MQGKVSFCIAIRTGREDPVHKWRIKNLQGQLAAFRQFKDINFDVIYTIWPSDDIRIPPSIPHKIIRMKGNFDRNKGYNVAAEASDAKYVFFADMDMLFPPDACSVIRRNVKKRQVYFPIWYSHGGYGPVIDESLWERRPHAYSQSGWIRTEILAIGGYPKKDCWGGDIDIFQKAKRNKFKVVRKDWPGDFKKGLVHQYHPHLARNFYYERDDRTLYTPLEHETGVKWKK